MKNGVVELKKRHWRSEKTPLAPYTYFTILDIEIHFLDKTFVSGEELYNFLHSILVDQRIQLHLSQFNW